MKKIEMTKKVERHTMLLVAFSIFGLFVLTFFPMVSVAEEDYIKKDLHFSIDMMTASNNEELLDLGDQLNLIMISFWAIIILSLVSFVGGIIFTSGKISIVGKISIISGCATLAFAVLIMLQIFRFNVNLDNFDKISASAIFPGFNYFYFLLIPGIMILIFSIFYTKGIVTFFIFLFKKSKKDKKPKPKKEKKKKKEKIEKIEEPEIDKESQTEEPKIDEKSKEVEQWLTGEIQQADEHKTTVAPVIEKVEKEEVKEIKKQPFPEEKTPTIEEKEKEEEKDDSQIVRISPSFDNALSSAVEKTQNEKEKKVLTKEQEDIKLHAVPLEKIDDKKPEIKEAPKKKFNIRCPQCKTVFTAEKGEQLTKIKCPHCGKEGFIK